MTTRDYLRARAIRLYRRSWPIVLVLFLVAIRESNNLLIMASVLLGVLAYLASYVLFMQRSPCLRCLAPLRNAASSWGSKRQPAPRCPQCGLGIDEPIVNSGQLKQLNKD